VVSVFALTVQDAARVMAVIDGPDGGPRFQEHPLRPPRWGAPLRIGVPRDGVGGDYAGCWDQALHDARRLGAHVSLVDTGTLDAVAHLLYEGPWVAERLTVMDALLRAKPEAVDPAVRRVVETAAPPPPTRADVAAEPLLRNRELGRFTNFVNLLGWAALAMPAGFMATRGLPFGVTFIAPGGSDAALAALGAAWQESLRLPLGARLAPAADDALAPESLIAAEPMLRLAVVGAHLQGQPLHGQLTQRRCVLRERTRTAPRYRLHALANSVPPKPGLARVERGGAGIEVEVYDMPQSQVGSFLALIPPPLGLGSVELESGEWVKGFICEPCGLADAPDISHHGGWRAYLAAR
jgi:allophanate hydrolase